MISEKLIPFGKIVATHGVKGHFVIDTSFDNPDFVLMKNAVYLNEKLFELKIEGRRPSNRSLIVSSLAVADLDHAKNLIGQLMQCKRSVIGVAESEDEFFVADLVGLMVYTSETNQYYGIISDVVSFAEAILVEIRPETKTADIRPEYYEFSEKYFPQVNITDGFAILTKQEYVLDDGDDSKE